MENKKNDILKNLIQKVDLDKPPLNFTSVIMGEIKAEVNSDVVINPALKSLLKATGIEKPSANFSARVMVQVKVLDVTNQHEPIISKKAWSIIFTIAACFFVLLGFLEKSAASAQGLTLHFITIGNRLTSILADIPSLYLITLVSISILLLLDYVLKIKGKTHENKSQPSR